MADEKALDPRETMAELEAVLYAAGGPVETERLCEIMEMDRDTVDRLCKQLAAQYRHEDRGLELTCTQAGYHLHASTKYMPQIQKALEGARERKLPKASLEVLAIVAYCGPVPEAYINEARGIDSYYTVSRLVKMGLLQIVGHQESTPGHPKMFGVTDLFLKTFKLNSLNDLPKLPEPPKERGLSPEAKKLLDYMREEHKP